MAGRDSGGGMLTPVSALLQADMRAHRSPPGRHCTEPRVARCSKVPAIIRGPQFNLTLSGGNCSVEVELWKGEKEVQCFGPSISYSKVWGRVVGVWGYGRPLSTPAAAAAAYRQPTAHLPCTSPPPTRTVPNHLHREALDDRRVHRWCVHLLRTRQQAIGNSGAGTIQQR